MMIDNKIVGFLSVVFVLLAGLEIDETQACSLSRPEILIVAKIKSDIFTTERNCLDTDCLFSLKRGQAEMFEILFSKPKFPAQLPIAWIFRRGKQTVISLEPDNLLEAAEMRQLFGLLIDDSDIDSLELLFNEETARWKKIMATNFMARSIEFHYYTSEYESQLIHQNSDEGGCFLSNYRRNSEWLSTFNTVKESCRVIEDPRTSCPKVVPLNMLPKSNLKNQDSPQLDSPRQRDMSACKSVEQAAKFEEVHYSINDEYVSCASTEACSAILIGFSPESELSLSITADIDSFIATGYNLRGTPGFRCQWRSAIGRIEQIHVKP